MTVAVGALCEDGKAGVMAADRAALPGDALLIDGRWQKLRALGKTLIGCCGRKEQTDLVLDKLNANTALTTADISHVADAITREREAVRAANVARVGPEFAALIKAVSDVAADKLATLLAGGMADVLREKIEDFGLIADFVAMGPKTAGKLSLWALERGGNPAVHDDIGIHAIGTGSLYALFTLVDFQIHPLVDLSTCLLGVYAAKKSAEFASGVGPETDLALIRDGHAPRFLSRDELNILEGLRKKGQSPRRISAPDKGVLSRIANK